MVETGGYGLGSGIILITIWDWVLNDGLVHQVEKNIPSNGCEIRPRKQFSITKL